VTVVRGASVFAGLALPPFVTLITRPGGHGVMQVTARKPHRSPGERA
jgi:hypothetical protein